MKHKEEQYWKDYRAAIADWNKKVTESLRAAKTPRDTAFWLSMYLNP